MAGNSAALSAGAARSQRITPVQIEHAERPIALNRRKVGNGKPAVTAQSGTVIHPSPVGVSIVPSPDIIVPPADITVPVALFWELLHLGRAKAVSQASEGGYPGKRVPITRSDVERHLAGLITLAFSPLDARKALFGALDVDDRFPALLP